MSRFLYTVSMMLVLIAPAVAQKDQARQRIEKVLSAMNGWTDPRSRPEVKEALAEIRRDPASHMRLLLTYSELERLSPDTPRDRRDNRRPGRALLLLIRVGDEAARAAVVDKLVELAAAFDRAQADLEARVKTYGKDPESQRRAREDVELARLKRQVSYLHKARGGIILSFGNVKDTRLRDHVLDRLEKGEEHTLVIDELNYLLLTAKDDPVVHARLRPLVNRIYLLQKDRYTPLVIP